MMHARRSRAYPVRDVIVSMIPNERRAREALRVFELAFEGIQKSSRHKSGIAVRFPRMARWRTDKKADEADTIETIRALLPH